MRIVLAEHRYEYKETEKFAKSIKKIQRLDQVGFLRIKKIIDRLLDNPKLSDGSLHGDKKGQFKKYVGESGYRLIYTWCEECKRLNFQEKNDCSTYCDLFPQNTIIFMDVFHKQDFRKLGY